MYLKKLQLINYRKFGDEQNVVEFVSSNIVSKTTDNLTLDQMIIKEDTPSSKGTEEIDKANKEEQIDIASDTTLLIGKNNAGKTTIITALDQLINHVSSFGINDFNYRYLSGYINNYDTEKSKDTPFIEFNITIELDEKSSDRISNLIPFMLVEDAEHSELVICIKYEIEDSLLFHENMKKLYERNEGKTIKFSEFINLLNNTNFSLNYYDKNKDKINVDIKLNNLISLQTIKANNVKNEHCLSDSFNKIINYRYEYLFKEEKKGVEDKLESINSDLTNEIQEKHTNVIKTVLEKLVSMKNMSINLSADITFEKLMKDLIKYEYIDNDAFIPENQFGLGYTNLVMIIAAIMDYIEKYPDTAFNSKINLISIEEPETFMHPQMQELFIKNINEAIQTLLSSKSKNVNSQIIISTHSSHILNSKIHSSNTFNNICYLSEKNHNAIVRNLNNKVVMPNETEDENSEDFKFMKKHIKYKVSELFFTDAAIFVEGFAEDLIIPYYIEKREKLNKHYISIFNINGAHGFLYERLIKALGIPVVIITDLDIKRGIVEKSNEKEDKDSNEETDDEIDDDEDETTGETSEKTTRKKKKDLSQISSLDGKVTTNNTIVHFNEMGEDISDISESIKKDNLYIAYQGKINGYYATSFEEAFILTNYDNNITNELLNELKPQIYKDITRSGTDTNQNKENSYLWQHKLENSKGEFASKLLYKLVNVEKDEDVPKLPDYISNGLTWIENELGGE